MTASLKGTPAHPPAALPLPSTLMPSPSNPHSGLCEPRSHCGRAAAAAAAVAEAAGQRDSWVLARECCWYGR